MSRMEVWWDDGSKNIREENYLYPSSKYMLLSPDRRHCVHISLIPRLYICSAGMQPSSCHSFIVQPRIPS